MRRLLKAYLTSLGLLRHDRTDLKRSLGGAREVRATLQKSNSSLSAEKQQVLLLQKRTGTLEALEQREAKERSEVRG